MTEPSPAPAKKSHGWIRTAVDFGGLLAFFAGYIVTHSLVTAAWWLVAGSAIALVVGFVFEKRLAPMPLISGVLALVFGTLTVFFKDPIFLKLKPTLTMTLFGVILLVFFLFHFFASFLRDLFPILKTYRVCITMSSDFSVSTKSLSNRYNRTPVRP